MTEDIKPENDTFSHLFSFAGANKAGMEETDKSYQAKVIYEMSKNSRYFQHALEQDRKTQLKVDEIKSNIAKISDLEKKKNKIQVENEMMNIEKHRNLQRICVVFDMDMFFAAVVIRDKPHLKDLPVAVGDMHMISTSNYVARKYGVRSAMPGFIGKKLCPNLIFESHSFSKYEEASNLAKEVIREYDPHFKSHSLDEFFVDLTSYCQQHITRRKVADIATYVLDNNVSNYNGNQDQYNYDHLKEIRVFAESVVHEIRDKIQIATRGLTCSAGIANNFMLAKISADVKKPNNQYSLSPDRCAILDFMETLPCRRVCGIGKVTEKLLSEMECGTMGEVKRNLYLFRYNLSNSLIHFLMRCSIGIDSDEIQGGKGGTGDNIHQVAGAENGNGTNCGTCGVSDHHNRAREFGRKSMSVERTFSALSNLSLLSIKLLEICDKIHQNMLEENLVCRTVTLKVKFSTFQLITRRTTLLAHTNDSKMIHDVAVKLLHEVFQSGINDQHLIESNVRLIGVNVSQFAHVNNNTIMTASTAKAYFQQSAIGKMFLSRDILNVDDVKSSECGEFSKNVHIDDNYENDNVQVKAHYGMRNEYEGAIDGKDVDSDLARGLNGDNCNRSHVDETCKDRMVAVALSDKKRKRDTNSGGKCVAYQDKGERCDRECNDSDTYDSDGYMQSENTFPNTYKKNNLAHIFSKNRIPDSDDSIASSAGAVLTCPVCGTASFKSMFQLNAHLDFCLVTETEVSKATDSSKRRLRSTLDFYYK